MIGEVRGGKRYYNADSLGSTRTVADGTGTDSATRETDAFGNVWAPGTTGVTATPFGFAGQHGYQTDADSGLMRLGHRYYDASTGRFLSRDPIQDGYNWYAYCENDPVNRIDPTGKIAVLLVVIWVLWLADRSAKPAGEVPDGFDQGERPSDIVYPPGGGGNIADAIDRVDHLADEMPPEGFPPGQGPPIVKTDDKALDRAIHEEQRKLKRGGNNDLSQEDLDEARENARSKKKRGGEERGRGRGGNW